ncbi:APC family permease [Edaphobacter sp.]|uniref:APC family permease n=1 Tax=Edaphobacter sp. TaxID=1934404 RepID=UPI002DBDBCC8|nr:APC family permease [Edaphobacter sp.]HEU5339686.1 APC family permease [Edaphobacter sp.]
MARANGNTNKMRLLPLVAATYFMVSGGPYGLEDIIGMAGYGWALLLLFAVPLLWSLPTSLMVGELAAALPFDGGFYHWVREALGPFWGFQEAWLSLAASVFDMAIYPTTFVLYLSRVAPELTSGHRGLLLKLAIVTISALWNLRGAVSVGLGSARMMAISLSPFVVLIALVLWHLIRHGIAPAAAGAPASADISGAIAITMWNYMGWDNASTIAQEVDEPQRAYPRAMLASTLTVMCVYMLPLVGVWMVGIPAARFSTGAWVDAAMLMGGPVLALAVVLSGSLDGLGTFNALTLSLTRLPSAMAEDGLLPRVLARRWSNGVPWVSVIACSIGWALALGFTFERLISIDLVLYGAALVLEFVALAVLRVKAPAMPRPFRIPGGLAATIALGVGPAALIAFALWTARGERVAGLPAPAFAALIALLGAVVYALRPRRPPTH